MTDLALILIAQAKERLQRAVEFEGATGEAVEALKALSPPAPPTIHLGPDDLTPPVNDREAE